MERAGLHCLKLLERKIEAVPVRDVQADEIWGLVGKKERNKTWEDGPASATLYCFIAMERDTKLALAYYLGKRSRYSTEQFPHKLRRATSPQRFQFITDGVPTVHGRHKPDPWRSRRL